MDAGEFKLIARWAVAAALLIALMVFGPALISAASSAAVMNGVFLGGVCVLGATLSVAGRFDRLYTLIYRTACDVINDK